MGTIHFNELKVTPDSKYLIVDVSVRSESYYRDVYLTGISIRTEGTYQGSPQEGEHFTLVYEETLRDGHNEFLDVDYKHKHYRWVLEASDMGIEDMNHLFFVTITTDGDIVNSNLETLPCGADDMTTMGTTVNLYPYYVQAMQYIKELGNTCDIPRNFIDYILKLKALELAIKTGNYGTAITYFKTFFDRNATITGGKDCGCK